MEARDLRALRGCERGDGLALGRTLAEVAFGYEGQAAEKDPARMQALENALDWRDVAGCACSPPPPAAKSRVRAPGTFVAADGREGAECEHWESAGSKRAGREAEPQGHLYQCALTAFSVQWCPPSRSSSSPLFGPRPSLVLRRRTPRQAHADADTPDSHGTDA